MGRVAQLAPAMSRGLAQLGWGGATYSIVVGSHMPESSQNPFLTGLRCRCPRCGKGKLFAGFLALAPSCPACGLDYAFASSGDGPAVFIIFVVGFIVIGLAATVEALFHPAPFIHLLIWIPAVIVLSLALIRPFKATMIALQFRHDAAEGRAR
jgi:uncharacterized protein (DUF983 family)